MSKGYYESSGSDYLNDSPSVSKNERNAVPEHNHDSRYYRKDEVDASQKDYDLQFSELEQDISQVRSGLESKSSIHHTHNLATNTEPGFMSAEDKRAMSALGNRTNIFITDATARTFPAAVTSKLIFDTEIDDSNEEYDKPNDVITVDRAGMYLISGSVELNNTSSTTAKIFLQVFKNGTLDMTFGIDNIPGSNTGGVSGSTCIHLDEGGSIALRLWTSVQVTTRGKTYFKVTRIW